MKRLGLFFVGLVGLAALVQAQSSVRTSGDIQADGQLVSGSTTGTPPLAVSSTTRVDNLNADLLDGKDSTDFADAVATAAALLTLEGEQSALFGQARALHLCRGQAIRYVDLGDGTVYDCQQDLQWLKDAGCLGVATWNGAVDVVIPAFNDGSIGDTCADYTPGSYQDWRLASRPEWSASIFDASAAGCSDPPLTSDLGLRFLSEVPDDASFSYVGRCADEGPLTFTGVASGDYWTSTGRSPGANPDFAWYVDLSGGGLVTFADKTVDRSVWPVRGGRSE